MAQRDVVATVVILARDQQARVPKVDWVVSAA